MQDSNELRVGMFVRQCQGGYQEGFGLTRSGEALALTAQGSGGDETTLEMKRVHVVLRCTVTGHGGVGLMVGLNDLRGLFQP